jgi:hypothetical protein
MSYLLQGVYTGFIASDFLIGIWPFFKYWHPPLWYLVPVIHLILT